MVEEGSNLTDLIPKPRLTLAFPSWLIHCFRDFLHILILQYEVLNLDKSAIIFFTSKEHNKSTALCRTAV